MSNAAPEDAGENGQQSDRTPQPPAGEFLPPVEPPSGRLIAQLFLIPGLVVAVLVGLVWLFFGWLAPGNYEPQDFLKGLRSSHDPVRWRTAQDLAQILPRKQELRLNVDFALQLTALLEEELDRDRASAASRDARDQSTASEEAPHLAEFLPAAVGHFHVPIAVPVLCRIIRDHVRHIAWLPGSGDGSGGGVVNVSGLRVRNSLVALATLGNRLEELEQLPADVQQDLLAALHRSADRGDAMARYARLAWEYLSRRVRQNALPHSAEVTPGAAGVSPPGDAAGGVPGTIVSGSDASVPELVAELRDALALAVACEDEMSRKYACLALANWPEGELEPLLLELLRGDRPPTLLDSATPQRAVQEIQYNAALALLRRRSPRTPWRWIEELLDESALQQRYREDSPQGYNVAAVSMAQLAALRTLYQVEQKHPGFVREHPTIVPLLEKLRSSGNAAVQVEARRLLGTESVSGLPPRRISREVLLLVGVGLGVGILLLLAVFARYKRHAVPAADSTPSRDPASSV